MKLGASTLFNPMEMLQPVEELLDLGISVIEVSLAYPVSCYPLKEIEGLKGLASDCHFSVHAPFLSHNIAHPDPRVREVAKLNIIEALWLANQIGGELVTLHLSSFIYEPSLSRLKAFSKVGISREEYLRRSIDSLREILRWAEYRGVALSIENYYGNILGNFEDIKFVFSELNSDFLKFTLDIGHAHLTGNISQFICSFKGKLAQVHLHDNKGKYDEHLRIGEGYIDPQHVLKELKEINYKGNIILELYSLEDIEISFKRLKALLTPNQSK